LIALQSDAIADFSYHFKNIKYETFLLVSIKINAYPCTFKCTADLSSREEEELNLSQAVMTGTFVAPTHENNQPPARRARSTHVDLRRQKNFLLKQ
jgi:hypothetical protein